MKHLLVALALLFAPVAAHAAPADLEAALAHAMADAKVPAMGALVIRAGQASAPAVRGVRRLGEADPVRPGDRWLLGSDGKAMTATLVARLVDEGKLSWTTPLAQMLPDLAAGMQPAYRTATLEDLLSHRAGLPENLGDEAYFKSLYDDPRPPAAQRLAYITRALAETPAGPARDEPRYSNTGFLIAGVIAERVGGKPYEELMVQKLFRPLGMTSVRFLPWRGPGPVGHVDGRVALQKFDPNPPMLDPAGGASMSLSDWARFCVDQLAGAQGHGRLLRPESYRRLQSGHDGGFGSGLGWGVGKKIMGRQGPALTHAGSDGAWYALVVLLPQSGNGVLVVANAGDSMGGDAAAATVVRDLIPSLAPPAVQEGK
ncbi:serine hydrolase [uncultured Phenylobacterium sp.]|uniref:serine hydrolase domain-containing protein n=1 Tax=uncultured Phenylobacterium sp. TaxID=349273 RepID=UPI0025D5AA3C|nr:serine hydrolase domain-containing protein [uncultured Phenylobacterium sp.]